MQLQDVTGSRSSDGRAPSCSPSPSRRVRQRAQPSNPPARETYLGEVRLDPLDPDLLLGEPGPVLLLGLLLLEDERKVARRLEPLGLLGDDLSVEVQVEGISLLRDVGGAGGGKSRRAKMSASRPCVWAGDSSPSLVWPLVLRAPNRWREGKRTLRPGP